MSLEMESTFLNTAEERWGGSREVGRGWDVIGLHTFPPGAFPGEEGGQGLKGQAGWLVGAGSVGWVSQGALGFGAWLRSTKHRQGSGPREHTIPPLSLGGCFLPVEVMGWQPLGSGVVPEVPVGVKPSPSEVASRTGSHMHPRGGSGGAGCSSPCLGAEGALGESQYPRGAAPRRAGGKPGGKAGEEAGAGPPNPARAHPRQPARSRPR